MPGNDSLQFDNVYCGDGIDGKYNILVTPSAPDFLPRPRIMTKALPILGNVIQGTAMEVPRDTINIVIVGRDWPDLRKKVRNFAALTNALKGMKRLELDMLPDEFMIGRFGNALKAPQRAPHVLEFSLEFVRDYGYLFELHDESFTIATNPDTFSIPASGVIGGNLEAWPCWYVRNETGSSKTNMIVNNTTTAESLTYGNSRFVQDDKWFCIATGDEPEFLGVPLAGNTRTRFTLQDSVTTAADPLTDTFVNAMKARECGKFPTLKAGVQNSVTVTGLTAGTLRVRWYERVF